jgi:hypothetical protein
MQHNMCLHVRLGKFLYIVKFSTCRICILTAADPAGAGFSLPTEIEQITKFNESLRHRFIFDGYVRMSSMLPVCYIIAG